MEKKVLIIGSGLLGCGLKSLFDQKGVSTKITMRRNSTEKSVVMKSLKKTFKEDLITNGGHVCDDIGDYREVVNNFKPDLAPKCDNNSRMRIWSQNGIAFHFKSNETHFRAFCLYP